MSLSLAARILWNMVRVATREGWDRNRLEAYQSSALRQLREHAYQHSPFYRQHHKGLEDAPLNQLPIVTKRQLMAAYDEVVTDPAVTHEDLQKHLLSEPDDELFNNSYIVCATSGTSGTPGIFPYSESEWAVLLASFARASRWAGSHVRLFDPMRLAIVGSDKLSHQSRVVADSFDSPWVPTLRLSATEPLHKIISQLNDFKPEMLVAYSALAGVLADEHLNGRLKVTPRIIMCVAEALKPTARKLIQEAWGIEPFENYAATELGVAAAECREHSGLHIFEDLTIVEFVDAEGNAVPPGTMSARILITPLFSTTFPLIRYELDDTATYTQEPCSCGLPFHRITKIGGRIAETLKLNGPDGNRIVIHPSDFDGVMSTTDAKAWQIVCHDKHLDVLILGPLDSSAVSEIDTSIADLLASKGLTAFGRKVKVVSQLPRLKSGKMAVVRDARSSKGSKANVEPT